MRLRLHVALTCVHCIGCQFAYLLISLNCLTQLQQTLSSKPLPNDDGRGAPPRLGRARQFTRISCTYVMAQQSQHEASGGGGIGAVQGNLNDIVTDVPSSTHFDFQFWLSLALVVIKSLWSLTVAVVLGVKSAILFVLSSTWRLSTGTLNLLLMPFKPFIYLFVFIVSPFVRITFAILDILRVCDFSYC